MVAARRASTGLLLVLVAASPAPSAARVGGRRLQMLLEEPPTLPPGCDLDCLLDKHPYLQVERTREAVEHVLRTEMNSKIYGLAQGPYACMCRGKVFDGGEPDPPLGERDPSKAAALLGACDLGCFFDNHLWLQRKIEHTEEAVLDLVRAKQLEIVPDACVCNGKATGRATENREIPDPGNREKEGNGNVKEPEAEAAGAAASEEAARLVEKRDNPDPVDQMKDDNSHRNEPATDAGNREIDSDEHLKEPEAEAAGAIGEAAPSVEEPGIGAALRSGNKTALAFLFFELAAVGLFVGYVGTRRAQSLPKSKREDPEGLPMRGLLPSLSTATSGDGGTVRRRIEKTAPPYALS